MYDKVAIVGGSVAGLVTALNIHQKLVEIIEDRIYQYMRSENRKIPLVKMQILSREVISEETLTKNALTNY